MSCLCRSQCIMSSKLEIRDPCFLHEHESRQVASHNINIIIIPHKKINICLKYHNFLCLIHKLLVNRLNLQPTYKRADYGIEILSTLTCNPQQQVQIMTISINIYFQIIIHTNKINECTYCHLGIQSMGPTSHRGYPLRHRRPTDDSTGYRKPQISRNVSEQEV